MTFENGVRTSLHGDKATSRENLESNKGRAYTKGPWEPTVSPTQIDDWQICERYWGLRTLVKGAYVQNLGAFRGEWGHKMLEAWGRDHTPPEALVNDFALEAALQFPGELEEKRIAAIDYAARLAETVNKMTVHLPEPPFAASGARIEGDFRVRVAGVLWSGRKDLETADAVWDYKFTSAPEYAKTAEMLPRDPQALTYAYEKMQRENLPEVTVKLLYGHVQAKPRAWVVEHTFTPGEIVDNLLPHNEVAKQLVQLRKRRADPMTLTPNWRACTHHGKDGCPFQSKCKPTQEQLLEAHAAVAFGESTEKGGINMQGGLLSGLMGPATVATNRNEVPATTNQVPAASATAAPATTAANQPRSDVAAAAADCQRDAANLLKLGLPRAEVVKAMCNRYVGLDPAIVEAMVPAAAPATDTPTNGAAINSGGAPAVAPKVEEKPAETAPAEKPSLTSVTAPKSGRKAAAKESPTVPGPTEPNAMATVGELDNQIRETLAQLKTDGTLTLADRANVILTLASATRQLLVQK